jgi:hypothetical protein
MTLPKKLYLASSNPGKLKEILAIANVAAAGLTLELLPASRNFRRTRRGPDFRRKRRRQGAPRARTLPTQQSAADDLRAGSSIVGRSNPA